MLGKVLGELEVRVEHERTEGRVEVKLLKGDLSLGVLGRFDDLPEVVGCIGVRAHRSCICKRGGSGGGG